MVKWKQEVCQYHYYFETLEKYVEIMLSEVHPDVRNYIVENYTDKTYELLLGSAKFILNFDANTDKTCKLAIRDVYRRFSQHGTKPKYLLKGYKVFDDRTR